eukprot:CAMPEP_0194032926 /NCGR_PEP_ID=MMETSP0009_2-20130614/5765_1 /TAXON_ID=210454 /ORGANISM="Grammatophora oceanica, Strain CCMP 410" /LENGTH=469 /DNA_ID=CAMNT_0038673507 /DNA_START=249 /DNA_END=1658 /DNA_ORIENTATION=-
MTTKESDITVFGATGWVGRYILEYLLEASKTEKKALKVTLAGRNKTKLETRKAALLSETTTFTGTELDVCIADSSDSKAIRAMVERTKVVICAAGPFFKYANHVVAACAQCGTDYVDITGEFTWAGTMRLKHGEASKKSGARIISLCGFDSIPSDISIYAAVHELRKLRGDNVKIESGTTWFACEGGLNGGTVATLVDFPFDKKQMFVDSDGKLRSVPWFIGSPLVLTHPKQVLHNPEYKAVQDKMAWSEWRNQLPSFDSVIRYGMSLPFFMAASNAKVVQASSVALKYGPAFTYRERHLPFGFGTTRLMSIWSSIPSILFWFGFNLLLTTFTLPVVGAMLANLTLPPGTGQPKEVCEKGWLEVYADVTAPAAAPSKEGNVDRATCFFSMKGDPGNFATAHTVGEAALSLLWNKTELPPRSEDGFGTPAELLGDVLVTRILGSKVRKATMTLKVLKDRPKNDVVVHKHV